MAEPSSNPRDVADALEALARRLRASAAGSPAQAPAQGGVGATVTPWMTAEGLPEEGPHLGALDVLNDGRNVTVTVETRNADAANVHVSLTETRLIIGLGEGAHAFKRDLPLPAEVDAEGAVATFRNGVLDVVLPLRRH